MKNKKPEEVEKSLKDKWLDWWYYSDNILKEILESILIIGFVILIFSPIIMIGYILAINLSLLIQLVIFFLAGSYLIALKVNDTCIDEQIIILSVVLLFSVIIGDIIYYFTWYGGSVDWLSPFIPK